MIESVRIMGRDWNIVPNPDLPADHRCVAQIHPRTLHIEIDPRRHEVDQGETLLHEIIEALVVVLPLDLEHDVLSRISQGIYTVLRDNPEVARHIVAGRRIVPKA